MSPWALLALLACEHKCPDGDNDGHADATVGCALAGPAAIPGDDCDDANPAVFPGALEACDGIDQDCDDAVDEDLESTWYADADGDGYGDPKAPVTACERPEGTVADDTDCDDGNATVRTCPITACHIQSIKVAKNEVYGQVRIPALTTDTDANSADPERVWAQWGSGPLYSHPETWPQDRWRDAGFNETCETCCAAAVDCEDLPWQRWEYVGTLDGSSQECAAVAFRFSVDDGASWSWCDGEDADEPVSAYDLDQQVLWDPGHHCVGWCGLTEPWSAVGDPTLTARGQVYLQGATGTGQPDTFVARVGLAPQGTDPLDTAAWEWTGADFEGVPGSNLGNFQYAAPVVPASPQASSTWSLLFSASHDDGASWALCAFDGSDGCVGTQVRNLYDDDGQSKVLAPVPTPECLPQVSFGGE